MSHVVESANLRNGELFIPSTHLERVNKTGSNKIIVITHYTRCGTNTSTTKNFSRKDFSLKKVFTMDFLRGFFAFSYCEEVQFQFQFGIISEWEREKSYLFISENF